MVTSNTQFSKLLAEEDFVDHAYKDGQTAAGVQLYSCCYGHQIQPSEKWMLTSKFTTSQGLDIFTKDLEVYENAVNSTNKRILTQGEFDALVDFAYNCGTGALAKVMQVWNDTGDSQQTIDHMKLYNKTRKNGSLVVSADLVERRASEAATFLSNAAGEVSDFVKANPGTALTAGAFVGAGLLLWGLLS